MVIYLLLLLITLVSLRFLFLKIFMGSLNNYQLFVVLERLLLMEHYISLKLIMMNILLKKKIPMI